MHFTILTLFPNLFESYLSDSILRRAISRKIIKIDFLNIRDFSKDKHKKVDDTPYGGGAGMLMTPQPLYDCIKTAKKKNKGPIIYLSPKGQILTHTKVIKLAKLKEMILLCGHYEGIDQRVIDLCVDMEISIGKYVLTGGELPALVIMDAVTRQIKGALHDETSSEYETFSRKLHGKKEYPHYTKPPVFKGLKVPEILLSGHHAEIKKWREKHLE